MRKLFIILISFLAIVTFIRAIDNPEETNLSFNRTLEPSMDGTPGGH